MLRRCRRRPPKKIDAYMIEAIRQASLQETQGELAMRLGIAPSTVARVQKREGFAHFSRHDRPSIARRQGAI